MLLRGRGLLLGLVLLTSLLGGGGLLRAQEYGDTPLHAAARDDDLTRVRSLVEAGAAVDARSNNGSTPLMFAAAKSTTPEIVQLLLDKGAAIDARGNPGFTPLMLAAAISTTPEIVELLLDKGANALLENEAGERAIDLAKKNEALKGTPAYWKLLNRSFG